MKKKEYLEKVKQSVDRSKTYPLLDALKLSQELARQKKTDETILVAYNLNTKPNERIRSTVSYPNSFGAEKKVLVFAKGEKAEEAKKAGAAHVGDDDLIEKIKGGWLDFDVAIAVPDMMKDVGKLGAVLGRKGLMPNPKVGTVTANVADAVRSFKSGTREFRSEKNGVLQVPVGKKSMDAQKIYDNIRALTDIVKKLRAADTKGDFILSSYLHSTMGPGIKFNIKELE
jgi:large subunit ribosomal protein L1